VLDDVSVRHLKGRNSYNFLYPRKFCFAFCLLRNTKAWFIFSKMNKNSIVKKVKNSQKLTKSHIDKSLIDDYKEILEHPYNSLTSVGKRYLDCVIDPKRSQPSRIPTIIGGDPGQTSVIKTKVEGQVSIGTLGFGYILLGSPAYNGFYSDRAVMCHTDGTYASASVSTGVATGLVFDFPPTPYPAAGAVNQYDYRLVAQSLEVFPTSSVTNQNGYIGMLEPASRTNLGGQSDISLAAWQRSRLLRGTQLGDPEIKIVLNIHPIQQVLPGNPTSELSPFSFSNQTSTANVLDANGQVGIIWFQGTVGTTYRFEMYAVYEFRGKGAPNPKVSLTNERDMNLALNTFRYKTLSGWVGKPMDAHRGYREVLMEVLRKVKDDPRAKSFVSRIPSYLLNMFRSASGF